MKKKGFKWVLRVAFAVVFFVSTALLAGKLQDGFSGSSDYEQALEIADKLGISRSYVSRI